MNCYRKCYPYSPLQKLTEKVESMRFHLLSTKDRLSLINRLQTEIIKKAMEIEYEEIATKKVAKGVWEAKTTTIAPFKAEIFVTAHREREAIWKLKRLLSGIDNYQN